VCGSTPRARCFAALLAVNRAVTLRRDPRTGMAELPVALVDGAGHFVQTTPAFVRGYWRNTHPRIRISPPTRWPRCAGARCGRVLGPVPKVDAWYQAFDFQPGDELNRAPGERARIW
jgi:hypothetical protein